ncbi:MAG: cell division protein FtsQ [Hyphomicrobiales bacterium]|nr:cell division protein FtsQ [Hyphomicrobiales bacterium]
MDGGRRLLRSLTGGLPAFASPRPALAGFADPRLDRYEDDQAYSAVRNRRRRGRSLTSRLLALATRRGVGLALALGFLGSTFVYGAQLGGHTDRFIEANGSPRDLLARAAGFRVDLITITGQRELGSDEILALSGVTDRNSLLFVDIVGMRDRLMSAPLIKDAKVRKLYPDRLVIEVTEREPFALWQKEGQVFIVSADGKPIDTLRDERFVALPFVVGEGANERVAEFQKIMEAAGDLRSKIRAGVLVTNRRWNVKLSTGVDVKLPEKSPERAIAALAKLSREQKILDKDLISIDMRTPGRLVARLSEEAAAVRAEALSKKPVRRGAV